MAINRLMILAGGVSSRMKRSVEGASGIDEKLLAEAAHRSKAMLSVGAGNRPFLDYLLYNAKRAGYEEIMIVVGERSEVMREAYGNADAGNAFHGLTISYAVQRIPPGRSKPLGTADAVLCGMNAAPHWAGSSFTSCNGDNLYSIDALRLMRECKSPFALIDYDRAALAFDHARVAQFAVLRTNADGFLTDILEKPTEEELLASADARGRIGVSMNIFRLSYDLIRPYLESLPLHPERHEKELPRAIRAFISDHPRSVRAIPLAEHVPDLTGRDDIPVMQKYLRAHFPEELWGKDTEL